MMNDSVKVVKQHRALAVALEAVARADPWKVLAAERQCPPDSWRVLQRSDSVGLLGQLKQRWSHVARSTRSTKQIHGHTVAGRACLGLDKDFNRFRSELRRDLYRRQWVAEVTEFSGAQGGNVSYQTHSVVAGSTLVSPGDLGGPALTAE